MTSIERSEEDRRLAPAVPGALDPLPAPLEPAGEEIPAQLEGGRRGRPSVPRTWLAALVGALILPVIVAASLTWAANSTTLFKSNPGDARLVSAADMEREYGVRVNLVAVTANGGLVDVRFTVIDKEKAAHILHDSASMPELFVEATGAVLSTRNPMAHKKLDLLDGATYFLLFPNSGGAIQRGTSVSVVIDGIRLAPIDAQS